MTRFTDFGSRGGDLNVKPPDTMGHESLFQRRPSLSHPGRLKYFFSDVQSVTLNYHTLRLIYDVSSIVSKTETLVMENYCPNSNEMIFRSFLKPSFLFCYAQWTVP